MIAPIKGLGKILGILGLIFFLNENAIAKTYTIDSQHSSIGFAVKHLMISMTTGQFNKFEGTIDFNPEDLAATQIVVTLQASSIDTNVEDRDNHLRSPDFLDVANHPTLTFKSTQVQVEGDGYLIIGDLTIRGTTKSISIPCTITGPVESPFGGKVIGISGKTSINRQDFGVSWNKALEAGGWVVSTEVQITVNVEAKE